MTNSTDRPINYGQVSVFQSPQHPDVLLADIAMLDPRGQLQWRAVPHESELYKSAIKDYESGILETVNYAFFIDKTGVPI